MRVLTRTYSHNGERSSALFIDIFPTRQCQSAARPAVVLVSYATSGGRGVVAQRVFRSDDPTVDKSEDRPLAYFPTEQEAERVCREMVAKIAAESATEIARAAAKRAAAKARMAANRKRIKERMEKQFGATAHDAPRTRRRVQRAGG